MRLLLPIAAFAAVGAAQVPPGWAVYSHVTNSNLGTTGGVSLVDPHSGTFVPLTGLPLPPDLIANPQGFGGAFCVLVRDEDGVVFAAPGRVLGRTVNIYEIELTGTAVTSITAHQVGAADQTFYASVFQMDWLPDGRIAFLQRNFVGMRQGIGILDPVTGSVSMRLVDPNQFNLYGMAASRDGSTLYINGYVGTSTQPSYVWTLPATGPGSPVPLGFVTYVITGKLAVDHHGLVHILSYGVLVLDPSAPTPGGMLSTRPMPPLFGIGIDRVTGRLLVSGQSQSWWWIDPVTGQESPVSNTYPNDAPTDIAYRNTLTPFGPSVSSANNYAWEWEGNPGGAPQSGNLGFSLTTTSSPGTAPGILALGAGSTAPFQIPSPLVRNVLLDPSQVGALLFLPPVTRITVPLPVPPGLPPLSVYAQTFHLEGNAWFGSRALSIRVY